MAANPETEKNAPLSSKQNEDPKKENEQLQQEIQLAVQQEVSDKFEKWKTELDKSEKESHQSENIETANEEEKTKRARHNRVEIAILWLPILLTFAALLQVFLPYLWALFPFLPPLPFAVPSDASTNLFLTIVSVAISVWVGLNLYNVVSHHELEELMASNDLLKEKLEAKLENANAVSLTAELCSRWRRSTENLTTPYLAKKLNDLDPLSLELLQYLLKCDDLYHAAFLTHQNQHDEDRSYQEYINYFMMVYHYIKNARSNGQITPDQYNLVRQYLRIIINDMDYFEGSAARKKPGTTDFRIKKAEKLHQYYLGCLLEYKSDLSEADRTAAPQNDSGKDNCYQQALRKEYSFLLNRLTICGFEERNFLTTMCNSLGSVYLVMLMPAEANNIMKKGTPIVLNRQTWEESLFFESLAYQYSDSVPDEKRAMYLRSIGAAYEHLNETDDTMENGLKALESYKKAWNLDPLNWKAAYCIASLYGKFIAKRWEGLFNAQLQLQPEAAVKLSAADKEQVVGLLKEMLYWKQVEKMMRGTGEDIYQQHAIKALEKLTGDPVYWKQSIAMKEIIHSHKKNVALQTSMHEIFKQSAK